MLAKARKGGGTVTMWQFFKIFVLIFKSKHVYHTVNITYIDISSLIICDRYFVHAFFVANIFSS